MIRTFAKTLLTMAVIAFAATSCMDEEIEQQAFSSNSAPVLLDATISEGDLDKIFEINGTTHRAAERGTFKLGFVVKENSQNPGAVYLYTSNGWKRINEARGSTIAGFWSTLSKNESVNARIIQEGTNSNAVYLFFGMGKVANYKKFRVDMGEVLKEHNQPTRTLPSGFGSAGLFFHDSDRADFPANWLGVKQGKLWNFGPLLNNVPNLIHVRRNGFGGADLNRESSESQKLKLLT